MKVIRTADFACPDGCCQITVDPTIMPSFPETVTVYVRPMFQILRDSDSSAYWFRAEDIHPDSVML